MNWAALGVVLLMLMVGYFACFLLAAGMARAILKVIRRA